MAKKPKLSPNTMTKPGMKPPATWHHPLGPHSKGSKPVAVAKPPVKKG
jgi:hypothetical protein